MKNFLFTLIAILFTISPFTQVNFYVNDNSTASDVFTSAIGNNTNAGSAAAYLDLQLCRKIFHVFNNLINPFILPNKQRL